jgi:PAS domain S-box-containing protein
MNSVPAATKGGRSEPNYYERLRELVRRDDDPSDRLRRILRLGADWFGVEQGLLARVDPAGTTYTIDEVSAPQPDLTRGLTGNLLSTYCRMVVAEQEPLALEHDPEQGGSAYRSALLATFIGAAVQVNGEPYGTVCFVDPAPEASSFDDEDQAFLDRVAEAVEAVLEAPADGEASPSQAPPSPSSAVERRYRTALKHSPIIFAKVDDELRYEWIHNPHPDFDPSAVLGRRDDEIDAGPGIDQLMRLKRRTLERGEQIREEIVFERSDGLNVYDVTATPLREGRGEAVTGLVTASLNITERRQTERKYRESEARYRALAENFPDGAVGVYDRALRYTLVAGTLLGEALPTADRLEGSRMPDVFPPETAADLEPLFRAAVEAGTTDSVETEYGGRSWRVWAAPLRDAEGTVFAGLSFAQDITEQKEREAALRRQRNLLSQAQRLAGAWEADLRAGALSWSETVCDIHEVPPGTDIALEDGFDFYPPEARARVRSAFERCAEEGTPYDLEVPLVTAEGRRRWVRTVGAPAEVQNGEVVKVAGAVQDITERKEAQSTLVDRQEKVQALYETTSRLPRAQRPDAVADHLHDLLGHFFDYPAMAVNLRRGDVLVPERVSLNESDEMPDAQPLPVEGRSVAAQAYRAEETVVVEDVSALDNDVAYGPIRSAAGVPIEGHGAVVVGRTEDGGFDSFLLRLVDILTAYAAAVLDRIDRKEALVEAKEEAEQAARLKTAMLSNMSHEIRTPLTSIISFAGILEDALSGQHEKYARLVHQGGERLMATLDSVLQLSKLEAGVDEATCRPVRLREAARATVEAYEQRAEEAGVTLTLDLPDAPVVARANEAAIDQALGNLVDNALKFTPEGGTVWVRVRADDEAACLAVEDTGIGIGEAARSDIFDAFEQESTGLTREYEGSGLGLAIAQRLVDQLGGTLDVESEKGEGSCFTIRLPRADDQA